MSDDVVEEDLELPQPLFNVIFVKKSGGRFFGKRWDIAEWELFLEDLAQPDEV